MKLARLSRLTKFRGGVEWKRTLPLTYISMKANKKVLTILVVVAIVALAVLGGLCAYKGDELMGFMRGQSKSKVAKLPWYCKPSGGDKGSDRSGGGGEPKSDSTRYVSPGTFELIHDLGPSGSEFWKYGEYFRGQVAPGTGGSGVGGDVRIPEFNVKGDEDEGGNEVEIHCYCPAYQWDPHHILTFGLDEDYFHSEFGGSEEEACEVYAPDQDCADPVTVTCTCNKEQKTQTVSSWQFENWYNGDSKVLCDSYYTEFECNPRWWCPTGSNSDYGKISDTCEQIIQSKKKSCALDVCPGLDFKDPPPVDSSVETFCKAFFGNNWAEYYTNVCDSITAENCPSMEDCGKYGDWFDADVSTGEMAELLEQEGESQEDIDTFLGVCGLFF